MQRFFPIALGFLLLAGLESVPGAEGHYYRNDPRKIEGTENCAECHSTITESWKQTEHYRTFFQMHRRREARRIASRLKLKRIKDNSLCLKCHYVSREVDGTVTTISGISCESCHGPAADWNKAHSNLMDPDRLKKARAKGLLSSADLYELASTCYVCHTVPEEKLVNEGGHRAGSEFELVSWLQGEVRHNIGSSSHQNLEATPEHKRILYVLGHALDLEHGLRGLATATADGEYAEGMIERVNYARAGLEKIHGKTRVKEVGQMLEIVRGVELKVNRKQILLAAAEKIGRRSKEFCNQPNQEALAALDKLIPGPGDYMGKVFQRTP